MRQQTFVHGIFLATWLIATAAFGEGVRIKDITTVDGARANQIYGTGLVVGLNGTGARSLSTQQIAIDMLRKMDVATKIARESLLDNVFRSNNISNVMVTAELPPFARKGSKIDVTVSVLDDALSLEGGILILTPLRGADGEVYAVSQGAVSIGGFRVRRSGSGGQQNHPTSGRIAGGAIVEREALGELHQEGSLKLLLNEPDSTTAQKITRLLTEKFRTPTRTIDPGTVEVLIPRQRCYDVVGFISEIGLLEIEPDYRARVVINERTGTVVVGRQVKITAVAVAHGTLTVQPMERPPGGRPGDPNAPPVVPGTGALDLQVQQLSQQVFDLQQQLAAVAGGVPGAAGVAAGPPPGQNQNLGTMLNYVEKSYTVDDLAKALNALGVNPRDLIAIFQALKEAGALHADLVIM